MNPQGANRPQHTGDNSPNAELNRRLNGPTPTLCVSLVRNEMDLARAVEDAGADGIKVHINLNHPHAGVRLGTFEEEADKLQAIVEALSIPVGIVPRGAPGTSVEEVRTYSRHGFGFVDLYSNVMSASLLAVPGIGKWVAPKFDYTPQMLTALSEVDGVDAIEAAFLAPADYGSPLMVDDLVRLRVALTAIGGRKPLILPTDRGLTEADIPVLVENGIDNFLIGYAVTGADQAEVVAATERFRAAIDKAGA